MPSFKYEGHLANGKAVNGSIEAASQEDAGQMLRANGVFVMKVAEGDISMVYDHAPKKRSEFKVHSPDDAPSNQPTPAPPPPQQKAQPKAEEPPKEKQDQLAETFFQIEVTRQALKNLCASSTKKAKSSKCHKTKARVWEVAMQKHIDAACTMALGMAIHENVKKLKDV